jgi:hypothetical protein
MTMSDDEPRNPHELSPEELAHFSPDGPVRIAMDWVDLVVVQQDLARAWPLTDSTLKLTMIQAALWNLRPDIVARPDRDEVAAALADDGDMHSLWEEFATAQLAAFQRGWSVYNPQTWGVVSTTAIAGPDLEHVMFAESGPEGRHFAEGVPVPILALLMHRANESWKVAGIGLSERLPVPGWPPVIPARENDPSPES